MTGVIQQFLLRSQSSFIGTYDVPSGYVEPSQAAAKIAAFFSLIFTLIMIMATFFFIRGGLDYVMSGGDPQKVKTGMLALQYSILGLIVAGVGFVVINIISKMLGITSMDLTL